MGILGERLRLLREKNGKTQEDISKVIGTTQQIYSRYETNKTELPVRHLLNLSSYYNVSTDYVNYLTYMENTEKLKKDDKTKNPIQ